MKALKTLFLLMALATLSVAHAQTRYYFNVSFKNKNNTTYSLAQPEAYLSARAIERRTAFNVPIDSTDLPVNQTYVSQVVALGTVVNNRSKWLNSITVHMTDSTIAQQIRALPFVKKAEYTGLRASGALVKQNAKLQQESTIDYGTANNQIEQMRGKFIHGLGYTGAGVVVAVLDAGFRNVNTNPGFDSLRLQGRLLGTKDFAVPGSNVYNEDAHGANVLSIMTGRLVGDTPYAGTAPHASYWLIRTEYAATEYMNEVDFWVSGIEFADSVGAEVVNSSLGYTTFDDPSMNYVYARDLNGNVSRASIAAGMAANKGILVCNSAGNEGSSAWKFIGAPADAHNIFAVGSNDASGLPSAFTSFGPSADGRTKPEISAQGSLTALINTSGTRSQGNGTSYSSPAFAGMLASFLQYYKTQSATRSVATIRNAIIQSASLYDSPTSRLGHGIPNFETAYTLLNAQLTAVPSTTQSNFALVHHSNNALSITRTSDSSAPTTLQILSVHGKLLHSQALHAQHNNISTTNLMPGLYIVRLQSSTGHEQTAKFVK